MANVFTIEEKEMSMGCPTRKETNAGRQKGTNREEMATIINTSNVEALKRFEIKGATTPVEIPDRSRTGRAYSGQITLVRKKRPAGRTTNFKKHNIKSIEVVFFMSFRIAINSIFKKLKNSRGIIKYRGNGRKMIPNFGDPIPAPIEPKITKRRIRSFFRNNFAFLHQKRVIHLFEVGNWKR